MISPATESSNSIEKRLECSKGLGDVLGPFGEMLGAILGGYLDGVEDLCEG